LAAVRRLEQRNLTTAHLKGKYREVFGKESDPITSSSCAAASPGPSRRTRGGGLSERAPPPVAFRR